MHVTLYQLMQASWLMLLGMGLVYLILGLMVLVTKLMSLLVQRIKNPSSPSPGHGSVSDTEMAAIAVALHLYRQSLLSGAESSKEGRQ